MTPIIRAAPLSVSLLGASAPHDPAKCYGEEIIALLDAVWPAVRAEAVPNDGINWVVYEEDGTLFAGVAAEPDDGPSVLEHRQIRVERYAEWTHTGPYDQLSEVGAELVRVLQEHGLDPAWPLIEVYGHFDPDPTKLETRIMVAID